MQMYIEFLRGLKN